MGSSATSWLRSRKSKTRRLALALIFAKHLVFDGETHAYWQYQTASRFSLHGPWKPARCTRLFSAWLSALLVATLPGLIPARRAERFRRRHFICRSRMGSR